MNAAAVGEAVQDVQGDGRWMCMHERFLAETKHREPDVVFMGDSLIANMQMFEFWHKMFVPLHSLNFGIGGDCTQNVLWRVQNGELDNIAPKVVVLLCGTNNHEHSAEQVVGGIVEVTRAIREKQPQCYCIVMAIPPRGRYPNRLREKIEQINKSVEEKISHIPSCQFHPIEASLFVDTDGTIDHVDMPDYLHFSQTGYLKFVETLWEEVESLLKNFLTADACSLDGEQSDDQL